MHYLSDIKDLSDLYCIGVVYIYIYIYIYVNYIIVYLFIYLFIK